MIRKLFDILYGVAREGPANLRHSPADTPERDGYYKLPATRQWSPGPRNSVDKTEWEPCEGCGRSIPVEFDRIIAGGEIKETGTVTYVCPFCSHCHVGSEFWHPDIKQQELCHECGAKLGDVYQCPSCSFPRGWMRVDCPYCKNRQPVLAPHWVAHCDTFRMECVRCERVFDSLCIC